MLPGEWAWSNRRPERPAYLPCSVALRRVPPEPEKGPACGAPFRVVEPGQQTPNVPLRMSGSGRLFSPIVRFGSSPHVSVPLLAQSSGSVENAS